jgi:hypothetical protein
VKPVRLEATLISFEGTLGIEVVARIALGREMIDQRWSVLDAGLFAFDQMGKIVIVGESVARLSENGLQFAAQRAMFDTLDLADELDPAVPDFQRGELGQAAHVSAISPNCSRRDCSRPLLQKISRQSGDRHASRQTFEICREIHAMQSLVEVIDVEQNVLFRGGECPEVHQMAVPASLDGNSGSRLMLEILSHYGGRTAKKGERAT